MIEAGDRHEEVLGEELAAADDEEHEADSEGERPEHCAGSSLPTARPS